MTFEDLGLDRVWVDFSSRPHGVFDVGLPPAEWSCGVQQSDARTPRYCHRSSAAYGPLVRRLEEAERGRLHEPPGVVSNLRTTGGL